MPPSEHLTAASVQSLPKVLLHDHLDGGLRPQTVLDLAAEASYDALPAEESTALGAWFREAADSGSLERYLMTFAHTVAVTQTPEALFRVASECAQDLAADGVVAAEVRFAPELHTARGLALDEVADAVLAGFCAGQDEAARAGHRIRVGTLFTAMRMSASSHDIAGLAVDFRDRGVVGFDIAGAEKGFPPSRHLDAFEFLRRQNAHFTIHAGEGFGLPSIWEALQVCGAERLGHGVRIVDDITVDEDGTAHLGPLAAYVRDRRVPLELCPSSNVQTGAVASIAEHPIRLLADLRFRVTVNTDNRLMSGTSMTREMLLLTEAFGWGRPEMRRLALNGAKSLFLPFDERLALIEDVIEPAYA